VTGQAQTIRDMRRLDAAIGIAVTESRAGYEFSANSYSFAAMTACFAAERALDDLRAALSAEFPATNEEKTP
jgi:hypothetical protein